MPYLAIASAAQQVGGDGATVGIYGHSRSFCQWFFVWEC